MSRFVGRNSAEVKRATIVGNPMFSADDKNSETVNSTDLPGLDDLQLDMDYDQIMHYFENLKVRADYWRRVVKCVIVIK